MNYWGWDLTVLLCSSPCSDTNAYVITEHAYVIYWYIDMKGDAQESGDHVVLWVPLLVTLNHQEEGIVSRSAAGQDNSLGSRMDSELWVWFKRKEIPP